MPATTNAAQTARIEERLDNIQCGMERIESGLNSLSADYRAFRENYARSHEQVESKADAAHRRIDTIDGKIAILEKTVSDTRFDVAHISSMITQMRAILVWIGVAVGGLVLTLVWNLITGQWSLLMGP